MKQLLTLFLIFLGFASVGQERKFHHAVDLGFVVTFKPSGHLRTQTQDYATFVFSCFKGYKYPSLRGRYSIRTEVRKNLELGAEAGVTLRYLEKKPVDNYYTFYSFPVMANASYKICKLNSVKTLTAGIGAGYNFKHPKHKNLDGLGGFTLGCNVTLRNSSNRVFYKLGYEMQQDRYSFKVEGFYNDVFTFKYAPYVNQIYFSTVIGIQ